MKHNLLKSFLLLLLVASIATACGNASTDTGSSPTAAPTATTASGSTPAATTASSGSAVQTASATVSGKSVTILTDPKGMTLYYRTSDTATSVCSGGCAQAWPPLLFSGSGKPTSPSTLPGTLGVISDTNGTQVTYQGHPLYTFASDSAAGQTNGEGVGGVWFVAATDLKAASSGSATPTASTNGY
ncbi:MAG TPA: hypothetical protein VGD98_19095 [Ktedonobacteraceae bacterium]